MKIVRFDIYHKTLTLLSFLGIDLCGPVLVHVELDGGGQDEGDEDKDDDDGDDPLQDGGDLVLGQLGDGDKVRGEHEHGGGVQSLLRESLVINNAPARENKMKELERSSAALFPVKCGNVNAGVA